MEVFCPWNIRKRAKDLKISQEKLAAVFDVDRTTINRWFHKPWHIPADALPYFAKELGCRVSDFFSEVPDEIYPNRPRD